MPLKGWVLHRMNRLFTRVDLPSGGLAREQPPPRGGRSPRSAELHPVAGRRAGLPSAAEHLGPYGPLISAIREELEDFVANHLRLHLAIAGQDRYLLTSIDVDCNDSSEARELLRRFIAEFTPEQIKHYVAKEIVARLPNASSIDLAQFAGLGAVPAPAEEEGYGELLSALRGPAAATGARPYRIRLSGRWSEVSAPATRAGDAARAASSPSTPLAGRRLDIDLEDSRGCRTVGFASVTPGRRYTIGKDATCDVAVEGVYTSRRHCEIWVEAGRWWVADAGSTNGIRVESSVGDMLGRSDAAAYSPAGRKPIEVPAGARVVLSASAQGEPAQYPRLRLRAEVPGSAHTAPAADRAPPTPVTPIAIPRVDSRLAVSARMASGERTVAIPDTGLPFRVGRSRSQALVIDWAHEGVSGHHLDIVDVDESGARVVVHGDNGVSVDGRSHAAGESFRWQPGETLVLGAVVANEPECTLTLARAS